MQKILCLDDEQSVLDGFKRQLHKEFNLTTANQGEAALKLLAEQGPFAVIVSDMRMPGMDGIKFLAKAHEIAPDSVRVMLTGAGDLQTAMDAVNEGRIFRFLTKPCPAEILANALNAALEQYRLVTAERELLENTLKGSIRVLVDILALTNPSAFSRANRLRHYMAQLVRRLGLANPWQYEVAALLSQLGCVTIPPDVLDKAIAGEILSEQEQEMFSTQSQVGGQFLASIPRLETVASIITQHQSLRKGSVQAVFDGHVPDPALAGALLLQMVSDFDLLLSRGMQTSKAIAHMGNQDNVYSRKLLDLLEQMEVPTLEKASRMVPISGLHKGMVLAEEVRTTNGTLVVHKEQPVTEVLRQRLENFRRQGLIPDALRVSFFVRSVQGGGEI